MEQDLSRSVLEAMIEREFKSRGSEIRSWSEHGNNGSMFSEYILFKNVPYQCAFGCPSRSEFLVQHMRRGNIRIECKWQQATGSVDEKFHFLFHNARDFMPEDEIWLVIDGGGYRPAALAWLKKEVAKVTHKDIFVMNTAETRDRIKSLFRQAVAA